MGKTWLQKYGTYEEEVTGETAGITAYATGGQANATELTTRFNSVDTVATAEDSVKLTDALTGKKIYVLNNTATTLSIYPASGEKINNTVDFKFNILGNDLAVFECLVDGSWVVYIYSQEATSIFTKTVSLSAAQIKTLNSVPVDAVAAPGANKAIEVVSASISFTWVGVAFDHAFPECGLKTDTAAANQAGGGDFTLTASFFTRFTIFATNSTTVVANKKLQISAAADSTASGDSTAKIYIQYRIINV